jgi:hypothetical protein
MTRVGLQRHSKKKTIIYLLFSYVLNILSAKIATEVAITELSVKLWNFFQFQNVTYTVRKESVVKLWRLVTAVKPTRLNVYPKNAG